MEDGRGIPRCSQDSWPEVNRWKQEILFPKKVEGKDWHLMLSSDLHGSAAACLHSQTPTQACTHIIHTRLIVYVWVCVYVRACVCARVRACMVAMAIYIQKFVH